ncbi:hypothetical protein ACJX0J_009947 [Zea mays]
MRLPMVDAHKPVIHIYHHSIGSLGPELALRSKIQNHKVGTYEHFVKNKCIPDLLLPRRGDMIVWVAAAGITGFAHGTGLLKKVLFSAHEYRFRIVLVFLLGWLNIKVTDFIYTEKWNFFGAGYSPRQCCAAVCPCIVLLWVPNGLNIFVENLVEKEEFLHTFSKECEYIRTAVTNGSAIKHDGSYESDPAVEIVRVELQGAAAFLLFSSGSTPIYIGEHGWEMLLVVKKATQEAGSKFELLGFASVHNFYHYPESIRLRISQILVLPPYQGEGHGLGLLEAINYIAQSENIYDVTIESPSDYLQYVRSSIDCLCLLMFDPIKPALGAIVSSLKETNLSKRAQSLRMVPPLKIKKKQFLRCWEILVFLSLDSQDHKSMDNFRACIYDLMKGEILGSASGTNRKRLLQMPTSFNKEASFAVYWTHEIGDVPTSNDVKMSLLRVGFLWEPPQITENKQGLGDRKHYLQYKY